MIRYAVALIVLSVALFSCGPRAPETERAGQKLKVFVSILPQACFVERVGGDYVDTQVLVGPGDSPATYAPTPKQTAALTHSDVYFSIGVPFEEPLMQKIPAIAGDLKVVDTRKGIQLRPIDDAHHDEHEGPHEHEAAMPDPHIWLSPKLVKIQAQTICETLCELDKPHTVQYRDNLSRFHDELDKLDAAITKSLSPFKGKEFMVFHPAFGYFADAYGLKQIAVETGGKDPSAKQLAGLIARAKKQSIRVIFVHKQYSKSTSEAIAESIGGVVVPVDPLPRDYLRSMAEIARHIAESMQPTESPR